MAGGAGSPSRKSGSGPKAPQTLSAAQTTELRDKIRDALDEIPAHQSDLTHSKAQFPPDFSRRAWRTAFNGADPTLRAQVRALNWSASSLMNELNNTVMPAVVLAGFLNVDQLKRAAPAHYHALTANGLIVEQTRTDLERANKIRANMTHHYSKATADDVHDLVLLLDRLTPKLLNDLGPWLTGLGV